MTLKGLDRVQALAELRAQISAQKLAKAQAAIIELETRADALRAPLPAHEGSSTISDEIARDHHSLWRMDQLRQLNLEIAERRAHAEPLRMAFGRDHARAEVLARLRAQGASRAKR